MRERNDDNRGPETAGPYDTPGAVDDHAPPATAGDATQTFPLELPARWGRLMALGIVVIVLGLIGVIFAVALTVASVLLFGAMALVAGGFQLWEGVSSSEDGWGGRVLHVVVGLAYLALGGLLIWDPVAGSLSLTLLLTAFLIALGLTRLAYAWRCRRQGWRWRLWGAGGTVNLVLAAIILYGWPATAFWVIGLIVAAEMILNGWLLVAVAMAARRQRRETDTLTDAAT